jgi:hypothetical protein
MNAKVADRVAVTEADTPAQSSEFESLLQAPSPQRAPAQATAVADAPPADVALAIEADVDGRRVRIVAQDEIVLECGNASITLRRNGRIVIKGTYVETSSEGTNRIKGGQVRIN